MIVYWRTDSSLCWSLLSFLKIKKTCSGLSLSRKLKTQEGHLQTVLSLADRDEQVHYYLFYYLQIMIMINYFIKCSKKNAPRSIPELKLFPVGVFCQTYSPKPKPPCLLSYETKKRSKPSHLRSWNQTMFHIYAWKLIRNFCFSRRLPMNLLVLLINEFH